MINNLENQSEHILIKNMVCSCCVRLVREDLSHIGVNVLNVKLGEATIIYDHSKISLKHISEVLKKLDLELIVDRNHGIVEEIKQTVIELIHYMNNTDSIMRKSEYLVEKMGRSYQTLSKLFSKYEAITLEKYIIFQKIEKVKELVINDKYSLSEIAWMMDYSSPHHLSNQFKTLTGVSLSDFKKNPGDYKKSINQPY